LGRCVGKVRFLFCIREGSKTVSKRVLTPDFHGDPSRPYGKPRGPHGRPR
jgi:hypothetical protein